MQERMTRWPRVDNLERARLNRAWDMVERERRTVTEATKRMTKRVEDVMTGMKESHCTGC